MAGLLVLADDGIELATIGFPFTGVLFGKNCL
jgi:hypothetical protein